MKVKLLFALAALVNTNAFSQAAFYSFVFLHKKTQTIELPKEELDRIMDGHRANIERLANEGKLLVAGPFGGGGGIFILNTTSPEEAQSWLNSDPGIKANRWDVEIYPYSPRVGSVCQVKPPFEMVSYEFIHYNANKTKSTARDYPHIFYKHDDFLKELAKKADVVAEGIFGEFDGGILITKGEIANDLIESDSAIQEGLLTIDVKTLWIAKGSFCEK